MATFTKDDEHKLDWFLLRYSSITKYFLPKHLTDDIIWLRAHEYKIIDIDCSILTTIPQVLKQIGSGLDFPDYFLGNSIDAFDDLLYDLHIAYKNGLVIVLHRYDVVMGLDSHQGWQILNILDRHSRQNLLYGLRLMTLVQSADPKLIIEPAGAQIVTWNLKEWLDSERKL